MKLQYVGTATVRLIGPYRFEAANDYACVVDDAALIGELLTQPGVDFVVAEDDPLARLVGAERAAELALDGILTPAAYEATVSATLSKQPKKRARKGFREEVGHTTEHL